MYALYVKQIVTHINTFIISFFSPTVSFLLFPCTVSSNTNKSFKKIKKKTVRKSAAIFKKKKNESRLSVVVRSSLTSRFEALKKLWFLKLKSAFKLRGEMLKFSKSSA